MRAGNGARLPLGLKLGYGVADVGLNIFFATTGLLLIPFMVTVLGISPAAASWVVLFPKLWDVVTDPMMGTISDLTRSRWGRRRPYLLAGSLVFSLSFVFLFSVPDLGSPGALAWFVAGMFVLCATCFTVFQVPYGAMTAEMTPDYHERTSLTAFRQVFASLGLLSAGALGPVLIAAGGGGREGYRLMALVLGAVAFGALFTCFLATARAPRLERTGPRIPFLRQWQLCWSNGPFAILATAYMVQTLAVSGLMAMIGLVSLYQIEAEDPNAATASITAALLVSAMLGMPVWAWIAGRIGKKRSYLIGTCWFGLATSLFWFVGAGDLVLATVLAGVVGLGMTSFQLFPWSMLPDTIDYDETKSGQRREGIYNGMWTAAQKVSLAIGPWILLQILAVLGFASSTGGERVAQPEAALFGLRLCFSVLPGLIFISGIFILRHYPLSHERMEEIRGSRGQGA